MNQDDKFLRAYNSLQKKIQWLAENGKLSEKALQDYNMILSDLADYFNDQDNIFTHFMNEARRAAMRDYFAMQFHKETILKLEAVAFIFGISEAELKFYLSADTAYLYQEASARRKEKYFIKPLFFENEDRKKSDNQPDTEEAQNQEKTGSGQDSPEGAK